jgi:hypothetical protein
MKRRMLVELDKRAAEAGEGITHIDVICEYIAEGNTLADLARDITGKVGLTVSAGVLTNYANSRNEWKAQLAAARALAAHVFAEDSVNVLDELAGTEVTKEEIALARARADVRQWLASKWNRPMYGADTAQVNVQVNLPGQHLDALRARAARAKIKATTEQQALPAGPDYETVPSGE